MFNFFTGKGQKEEERELVSIIIPSYNHELYIGKAIQSVVNQTYSNWELIIVDDGSTDNSIKRIKNFKDARICLIEQENRGAHNAINRGLEQAKGYYLAILNSDDIYEKDRIAFMVKEMKRKPEIGFICSYIQVIDSNGKELGIKKGWRNMEPWTVPHKELSFASTDDFKRNLLMSNFTSTTSNFFFTRKLFEKVGGMRNLRFAHDWDFALRAAEATECAIIEKPLLKYRVHESNTISSNRKWMLFEIAWIWAANLERFYGSLLFANEGDKRDIIPLAESLNLQGNDKILWIIKFFIDAQRKAGVENPEEILLEDEGLRNMLLEYVEE